LIVDEIERTFERVMENENLSSNEGDNQIVNLETLLEEYLKSQYEFLTSLNSFDAQGPGSESIAQVREKSHQLSEVTDRLVSAAALLKAHAPAGEASQIEELKEYIRQRHAHLDPPATRYRLGMFCQQLERALIDDEQRSGLHLEMNELSETLQNWDRTLEDLIHDIEVPGLSEALRSQERKRSLSKLASLGVDPYPHKFDRTHSVSQVVRQFENKTGEELEAERPQARVAGRIHAINKMGKAAFIRFTDGTELVQIYIKSNEVDERTWEVFKLLDLGDFIGAKGQMFRTKTNELSIHAESLTFLAKAIDPPPDKYYGLNDIELRYRQRYADLIANREVRRVFETRSLVIRLIRGFFDERGYMEVETPMLTSLPTGAAARPFKTHHNALDIDLYARIAPELYLKRLIVGGFEKVYEINRNFRNEGIDRSHNPEFTMLEWYEAYSEYEDLIKLTEDLISELVQEVRGKQDAAVFPAGVMKMVWQYGESTIDFARPWKRLTMREAVIHYWPDDQGRPTLEDLSTSEGILRLAEQDQPLKSQFPHFRTLDYGHLLGEVFEHVAEAHLIDPTFITEFPTELSPLSKQNQDDPRFVDRFELYIAGMEIANGFCEINDPVDQRQRFEAQMKLRERGDEEAMVIDEDYIRALSYGMPPTAGEGIGIDRLVMVLTNSRSIRDVILFPHMRPEKPEGSRQ
jgi:lysyl-tRNA synthetase class 2